MTDPLVVARTVGGGVDENLWLGGGVTARILVPSRLTGGAVSLVEHGMAPGSLIEPHVHQRECEISVVVEGRLGGLVGGTEIEVEAGEVLIKPPGIAHAVWNNGPEPARFLEIVAPGGFESFFEQLSAVIADVDDAALDEAMSELAARFGLRFELDGVEALIRRHRLHAAAELWGIPDVGTQD
jgi:quercetin dioxygenase-like cupin family protein